ncbi:hypothetical protein C1H46_000225 [Malus baccata]|uniref:Uncharacterized protein n=1 Tax=Malus baccata TaxID=106549 RepID=A0A540NTE2_MALBA|nr:hypothetical protein C1H46_000225 [Malus baccata]
MGNPIGKFNLKPNPVENFSDLYTDAGLKALNKFLADKSYISSDKLTLDDIKVYVVVFEKPPVLLPM